MSAELRSTGHGQTLVLTLSNPGLRNALDPAIYAAGIEALGSAERNAEVRSVVLTGEGGVFSAGGNLQRLQTQRVQDLPAQQASITALHDWIEAIRTYPKPIIAAVEGAAAGAGFSLSLACDMIVAADTASFGMAEASLGMLPLLGDGPQQGLQHVIVATYSDCLLAPTDLPVPDFVAALSAPRAGTVPCARNRSNIGSPPTGQCACYESSSRSRFSPRPLPRPRRARPNSTPRASLRARRMAKS